MEGYILAVVLFVIILVGIIKVSKFSGNNNDEVEQILRNIDIKKDENGL